MSALLMEISKKIELKFKGLPLTEFELNRLQPLELIAERYKWKSKLRDSLILGRLRPDVPIENAQVILTRYTCRPPNDRSLIASFKGIVDGLIEYGIIKPNADIKYKSVTCGKHNVHINIEVKYCEI